MKTSIKDHALLLVCASIIAGLAWAFWHFLGEHGLGVLMMIALLGLAFDNYRLRRRLRREQ
jgi:membrane protease YdiL (CAAX protease family)